VSAAAFFGNSFVVDLGARSVLRSHEAVIEIAPWKLNEAIAADFGEKAAAGGKTYVPFALDAAAVEKALRARESRWRKVEGKQSQALLDLLFEAADRQGIRYFFLLTPMPERETFPLRRGELGAACSDDAAKPRAYVYFFARFTLWDVANRKKLHESIVDPSATAATTFGDCEAVAAVADMKSALEDPVKRTAANLVSILLTRAGL